MSDFAAAPAPRINVAEYSVSEISAELKRTVEDKFAYVRVRGEISGFKGTHSSGHSYFSLAIEISARDRGDGARRRRRADGVA
jgi:exodeoxyribonuclease VII large subunit